MKTIREITTLILLTIISISAYGQNLKPKLSDKGKFGYVNEAGKWKIKAKYTYAKAFDESGFAIVKKDDKSGLINESGKEIFKPKYEDIIYLPIMNSYVAVESNNDGEYYDIKTESKIDVESVTKNPFNGCTEVCFTVKYNTSHEKLAADFSDSNLQLGKLLTQKGTRHNERKAELFDVSARSPRCKFSALIHTQNSKRVAAPNWKYDNYENGYSWEKLGEYVLLFPTEEAARQNNANSSGLIKDGILISEGEIDKTYINNGFYGFGNMYINNNGDAFEREGYVFKNKTTGKYRLNLNSNTEYAKAKTIVANGGDGYYGINIINDGTTWSICKYDKNALTPNVLYKFKNPGDEKTLVTPCNEAKEGLFYFRDNNKFGLINYEGKIIFDCKYDDINRWQYNIYGLQSGDSITYKQNQYSYGHDIEFPSEVTISKDYELLDCWKYQNNSYAVKDKTTGQTYLFNNGKKVILKHNYDEFQGLQQHQYLLGVRNETTYVINPKTGTELFSGLDYDGFQTAKNNSVFIVYKNKKQGIVDLKTGRVYVPCNYDNVLFSGKNYHCAFKLINSGNNIRYDIYDNNHRIIWKKEVSVYISRNENRQILLSIAKKYFNHKTGKTEQEYNISGANYRWAYNELKQMY